MRLDAINPHDYHSPFDDLIGTRVEHVAADRVVLVITVRPDLYQPHGVVHGGLYATLAETASGLGANAFLEGTGKSALGVSNHTDFMGAVREGELRAVGTPLQRGRTLQLWQVDITDGRGRRVAHAKVKLMNLRP